MKVQVALFLTVLLIGQINAFSEESAQKAIAGFLNGIIGVDDYEEIKQCMDHDDRL